MKRKGELTSLFVKMCPFEFILVFSPFQGIMQNIHIHYLRCRWLSYETLEMM